MKKPTLHKQFVLG